MSKWPVLCVIGLLLAAGCKTTARPNWFRPGTAQQQQARATRFDPYPETNIGPPMTGVRPREFDRSIPEVDRAQQFSQTYQFAPPGAP